MKGNPRMYGVGIHLGNPLEFSPVSALVSSRGPRNLKGSQSPVCEALCNARGLAYQDRPKSIVVVIRGVTVA